MNVELVIDDQKFTITKTECIMKCIRFLLLTITTLFMVIAGLMIVVGITVFLHYHSLSFFHDSLKPSGYLTPSVLSMIIGLLLLIVSSFGFFGSLKQSTCLVNFYALILALILVVEMVVVIMAFTLDKNTIASFINIPVQRYTYDSEIRDEIDSLQKRFYCCGSNSFLDYMGMQFNGSQSTVIVSEEVSGHIVTLQIPTSCCQMIFEEICTMHSIGCKVTLVEELKQNAHTLGNISLSVMFVQLLGVIFAVLLARCIRKVKSEKALMALKIQEQMIMAQEAEADLNRGNSVLI